MENLKLDAFERNIKGKRVAVIGLGVSNIPLIDYLHNLMAKVTVFDERDISKLDEKTVNKIEGYGFELVTGKNALHFLRGYNIIFRSPSCLPTTLQLVSEQKRGAIVTSEIEMLMNTCPCKIIGVTGSDGKTTTTTLIYEILKKKGYNCHLGGNLGIPLFTKVREFNENDIVVLELSSFQLMGMEVSPDISVITNISPNHLDKHKSYEEYIEAKKTIFNYQDKNGIVVLNYDNDITREFKNEAEGKVIYFSSKEKLEDGIIYDDGMIKSCEDGVRKHLLNVKNVHLRGVHNYENICAAIAATSSLVDSKTQVEAIEEFKGVEHRLEFVREINGVKWYNDSIGTSPTRTSAGLNSFDEKIVLIAGGYDKNLDYEPLAKPILEKVSKLVLFGNTTTKIYDAVIKELSKKDPTAVFPIYKHKTLEQVVNRAYKIAEPGEVVLFSPASASFDMFKNFEERGEKFKELVMGI
jgi:UDP-N-acetylmuramoylalanine--D-glutamate ligase